MLETIAVVGVISGLFAWFRHTSAPKLARETSPFLPGGVPPDVAATLFTPRPGGGVALTQNARALFVTTAQAAGSQVLSFDGNAGLAIIGPATSTPDASGGGSAIDLLRGAPTFDIWISTMALDATEPGEVVFEEPGKMPIMDPAKNEPPLAGSVAMAANVSVPSMVLFARKGEAF